MNRKSIISLAFPATLKTIFPFIAVAAVFLWDALRRLRLPSSCTAHLMLTKRANFCKRVKTPSKGARYCASATAGWCLVPEIQFCWRRTLNMPPSTCNMFMATPNAGMRAYMIEGLLHRTTPNIMICEKRQCAMCRDTFLSKMLRMVLSLFWSLLIGGFLGNRHSPTFTPANCKVSLFRQTKVDF